MLNFVSFNKVILAWSNPNREREREKTYSNKNLATIAGEYFQSKESIKESRQSLNPLEKIRKLCIDFFLTPNILKHKTKMLNVNLFFAQVYQQREEQCIVHIWCID